jgi:glycosyltransferase involved in cell wall biosynthesis
MTQLMTIAIPVHTRSKYLPEALASARAQTYEPLEIVVSHNAEGAEIQGFVERIASKDPRVTYLRNRDDNSMTGNWNHLAARARGEFIIYLADDDRLLPRALATMAEAAKDSFDVAFSNHFVIDVNGDRMEKETRALARQYHREELPAGPLRSAATFVWRNAIPICTALIRTRRIRQLRFQAGLNNPEIEFFARLVNDGGKFTFCPDYLAEYRTHPDSGTSRGLTAELLARYLEPIPAPPESEPSKREFMGQLLINAVSRCLQRGAMEEARQFLRSQYYPDPHRRTCVGGIQVLCANLPPFASRNLYRLAIKLKSLLRWRAHVTTEHGVRIESDQVRHS